MALTATVAAGAPTALVDLYIAIRLPDQTLLFLQPDRSLASEPRPFVAGWTVQPFAGEIFQYTLTGAEPLGAYTWLGGFTKSGTAEIIGDIALSVGDCGGLVVDETCQLGVIVRSTEGAVLSGAQLDWTTPDITIATVDFEGRVTGVSEGAATIFAKSAPGPSSVCQQQGVVCDSLVIFVDEPDPGPGPQP